MADKLRRASKAHAARHLARNRKARLRAGALWRRFASLACLMLGACASPPQPTSIPAAAVRPDGSASSVFEVAPGAGESNSPAVTSALSVSIPADTRHLPSADGRLLPGSHANLRAPAAFEGERREVKDVLPRVAGIDLTAQPDDLWQRIRRGFGMPDLDGPLVQEKMAWYAARPDSLRRTLERGRLYLFHIVEELEKRGMPTELALLPMVESSFNPMAYSRAHASGLWQFIPPTGRRYSLAQNWWFDARRDIVASTSAALDYLRDIYELHGDWHLSLASYNWGENAVARAIEKNRAARLPTDYSSLSMPLETRQYVPKLQALKNIIANPGPFGINLDPIPNQPYFTTVTRIGDIDLRLAAGLAEMTVQEFIALNPGYNRPLMPVAVNPRIVLPADKVEVFHSNLEKIGDKSLVSWQTYRPARGERLEAIAKRYAIPLAQLREVNGMARRVRELPALLIVPSQPKAIGSSRLPIVYAPPIAARPAPPPRPIAVMHVVQRGETLSGIAARYGVSSHALRRSNKIGRLLPGQQLLVRKAATATERPQVKSNKVRKK